MICGLGALASVASAGCATENTPTATPPVSSTTIDIDAGAIPSPTAATTTIDAGVTAAVDPNAQENPACGGTELDLAAVLANKKCRAGRDAPPTPANAITDIKVTLTPSAQKIAPGGHIDFTLEIANSGTTSIPLYFSGDLTLAVAVTDAKGTRLAPPAGNAPKNADPKCADKDCRLPESHIVLAAGGKAHAHIGFDAVKVAWPATGPTTCCTVHVDPVAKGSLANGTYKVKIPLPYESNQGNPSDPEVAIQVAK